MSKEADPVKLMCCWNVIQMNLEKASCDFQEFIIKLLEILVWPNGKQQIILNKKWACSTSSQLYQLCLACKDENYQRIWLQR